MKNVLHLTEVLENIIHIEFCEDVTREPRYLAASSDIEDDFEKMLQFDKIAITLTDDQLLKMSDANMGSIVDGELLHRLNKLCPERLTADQISILTKYYSDTRLVIDDEDIKDFLVKLKQCDSISYNYRNKRTNAFALDINRKLRESDCLDIIKSLSLDDYREAMYGADRHFYGDNLLVFRPTIEWVTNDKTVYTDILVYIKLDLDMASGDSIALVSFHDAKYED